MPGLPSFLVYTRRRALKVLDLVHGGPLTASTAPHMTYIDLNRCMEPNCPEGTLALQGGEEVRSYWPAG
jgi:hypothetical protein